VARACSTRVGKLSNEVCSTRVLLGRAAAVDRKRAHGNEVADLDHADASGRCSARRQRAHWLAAAWRMLDSACPDIALSTEAQAARLLANDPLEILLSFALDVVRSRDGFELPTRVHAFVGIYGVQAAVHVCT